MAVLTAVSDPLVLHESLTALLHHLCSLRQEMPAAPSTASPPLAVPQFGPVVKLHLPAGSRISVLPKHELTSLMAILPPCAKLSLGQGRLQVEQIAKYLHIWLAMEQTQVGFHRIRVSVFIREVKLLEFSCFEGVRSLFHAACLFS